MRRFRRGLPGMSAAALHLRRCFGCDATSAEAAFAGDRKPANKRDFCWPCQTDPPALATERVMARRRAIITRRAERRAEAAKKSYKIRVAPAGVASGGIIDV